MADFFAISVDRATTEQLNAVHEVLKKHAHGWWHHHTNLWIVGGGKNATFWRDLIKDAIGGALTPQASVLVLRLPSETDGRWWAAKGIKAKKMGEWLRNNYTKKVSGI